MNKKILFCILGIGIVGLLISGLLALYGVKFSIYFIFFSMLVSAVSFTALVMSIFMQDKIDSSSSNLLNEEKIIIKELDRTLKNFDDAVEKLNEDDKELKPKKKVEPPNKKAIAMENSIVSFQSLAIDEASGPDNLDITEFFDDYSVENPEDFENIIFLNWCNNKIFPNNYPNYLAYDYKINDPEDRHREFIETGLLTESSYEQFLDRQNITELKEVLRRNELKVSGRKPELVKRILRNLSDSSLYVMSHNNGVMYSLSEAGYDVIQRNNGIIWLHKNRSRYSIYKADLLEAKANLMEEFNFTTAMNWIIGSVLSKRDYRRFNIQLMIKDCLKALGRNESYLYQTLLMALENLNTNYQLENSGAEEFSYLISPNQAEEIRQYHEFYSPALIDLIYSHTSDDISCPIDIYKLIVDEIFNGNEITPELYQELLEF